MNDGRCTNCGNTGLEQGWMTDLGQGTKGFARWIPGPLERNIMGMAKFRRYRGLPIQGYRCRSCGHLDLFATGEG